MQDSGNSLQMANVMRGSNLVDCSISQIDGQTEKLKPMNETDDFPNENIIKATAAC